MKQLFSNASNLIVAIHDEKPQGRRALPMAEIVFTSAESSYRLIGNQLVQEPELTSYRTTVDRKGLKSLIEDLSKVEEELGKLEDHFDGTQGKLPL